MKLTLKLAVSAALLTAATASYAQLVPPTPPATFPTDGSMGSNNNNGALLVQVYDPITGASLTEFTGLHFNDIQPSVASGAGYTADFGIIGGSLFASTFGSDTNTLDFLVVSAANQVSGSSSILTTLTAPPPPPKLTNGNVANAAAKFGTAVGVLTSGQPANANQAAGVNPAQTFTTTDNGYTAVTSLGSSFGGNIGTPGIAGTVGGAGAFFYKVTQTSTSTLANATATQYGNASGAALWTMAKNGDLTFTVPGGTAVPLPPAIWLLGSGLLGLAGIGRRRAAAQA